MTAEMIIEELQYRGFNAKSHNVVKNGIELEGIIILNDTPIAPVIYTEELISKANEENQSIETVVDTILSMYENHKELPFDTSLFHNRDFILQNIFIGLQKTSSDELIKKACDELNGIESYLYMRIELPDHTQGSVKLHHALLEKATISEEEAWCIAKHNTFAETKLSSMRKVLENYFDLDFPTELEPEMPLHILTNQNNFRGASAILNKQVLKDFGATYNVDKILVLPSSIHEMLIAPYTEDMNIEEFSYMVTEVNHTQVDPTERLTDTAYILSIA